MSALWAFAAWLQHNGVVAMTAVFVLIFATTYWPGRKAQVEQHALIPLDDDR